MTRRPLLAAACASVALALPATAGAADFAPAADATIRPGSETRTVGSGQCTSNFLFTRGADVLIGQAAHCSGTGQATSTDGCASGTQPLGTKVDVEGAKEQGEIVYSSWNAMQAAGETDPNTCAYNDFALIRLAPSDAARANPSVPFYGGPVALGADTAAGDEVFSYGNSSLRAGLELLKPKFGVSLGQAGGGWSHDVFTVSPGVPGDSGSGFLSRDGRALGTLSTLQFAPVAGSNGVSDLRRQVAYARSHGQAGLELATGTEPFGGNVAAGLAREGAPRAQKDLEGVLDGSTLATIGGTLLG